MFLWVIFSTFDLQTNKPTPLATSLPGVSVNEGNPVILYMLSCFVESWLQTDVEHRAVSAAVQHQSYQCFFNLSQAPPTQNIMLTNYSSNSTQYSCSKKIKSHITIAFSYTKIIKHAWIKLLYCQLMQFW